jgi:hypothetical protein
MRRWAAGQGAQARVEAYTPDRRRRSDVAVTLPDGRRVAIEVQLGAVSDAEWLARHQDYARTGITDVWLWHTATWVPRVMFDVGQPGWILDLDNDRLGLLHAQPRPASGVPEPGLPGCGEVHWPPCPGDQLSTLWMPLGSAQQLTPEGINLSPEAAAQIARQAAAARSTAERAARQAATGTQQDPSSGRPAATPAKPAAGPPTGRGVQIHQAYRYDARPPWTDPDTWWYLCDECGNSRITDAELKASPIIHIVATLERLTSTGKPLINYVQHGGATSSVAEERPADPWAQQGA